MSLSIVTWLWKGNRGYQPGHVAVLAAMFRRRLSLPHRFVCITDMDGDFGEGVDVMPMPQDAAWLGRFRTPEAGNFPSCYRRLWMFSDEARCLGDRVMLVDVDMVLTGSVDHLFDHDAPFVGWQPRKSWGHGDRLGGGMYLMTTGAHPEVFYEFEGESSITEARAAGFRGSDQAWISYKLCGDVDLWPHSAGVYSIRDIGNSLPEDACLVQFNGPVKPWQSGLRWVKQNWRL